MSLLAKKLREKSKKNYFGNSPKFNRSGLFSIYYCNILELIGMDQAAIGFVQMIFTIAVCCLDIPMGYIADRFSRKIPNVIGDIGVAFMFVLYTLAQDIYIVLILNFINSF